MEHRREYAGSRAFRGGNGICLCGMGKLPVLQIRRTFSDVLLSIGAMSVLLAILISINDRVRSEVTTRLTAAHAHTELAELVADAHDIAAVVVDAARHQTIEHAPLVIFVIAATILVFFMLRL